MELRSLEYFLTLTREGSVSAAARALHVSQPTLSRQLIELERELGATLFERGRHGITLTEAGTLLRRRASEICELARITMGEVAGVRGQVAGTIRLGCAETRAMDVLASVMCAFRRDYPHVRFRVTSKIAEDVAERVNRGLLDFGLTLRVRDHWGLESLRLATGERAEVVMRADCPLAVNETVTLDDLAAFPVLVPESWRESGLLGGERPREDGGRLDVVAEFDLAYNASRMVLAGMGCAVMLAGLLRGREGAGLVTRPLDVCLDMPSYLVWKPTQLRTCACTTFLQRASEALGSHDDTAGNGR